MCNSWKRLLGVVGICFIVLAGSNARADVKEWTFMVFLNGNNSLDSYGALNISQMEKVGSTKDINIVVQWASEAATTTKRLLVVKNPNPTPNQVISPTVQEMPVVDMGDYNSVVDFVQWTVANYPAKHYFLSLWDHGSGWHRGDRQMFKPFDISFDDISGHSISTAQTGVAMGLVAKAIGHKLDILGNDACLMAMVEVAQEVADSVQIYAGSETTEPGAGWPYDTFMARWAADATVNAATIATQLTEEYVKSYQTGDGASEVTFSAFNLEKMDGLSKSVAKLGTQLGKLDATGLAAIRTAAGTTQSYESDYLDLGDLLTNVEHGARGVLPTELLQGVRTAITDFVIANKDTASFAKSTGASIWLPYDKSTYDLYSAKYEPLKFNVATGWGKALETLVAGTR